MKRMVQFIRDTAGLTAAAAALTAAREPSPIPALLLLLVVCCSILYVVSMWLQQRFEDRPPGERGRSLFRPADFAARRSFRAAVVLVRDVTWAGAQFDRLPGHWPASMRGYYAVWCGRHRLVGGGEHPAVLDFVLYPDEIFMRRLHAANGSWQPEHPENEEEFRKLGQGGPFGPWRDTLVDYLQLAASLPEERRQPAHPIPLLRAVEALLGRTEAGEATDGILDEADTLGATLIGVPLRIETLQALTRLVTGRGRHHAEAGAYGRGLKLLEVGLRILPGDPYLLTTQAGLLADVGLPEEALRAADDALCRERILDARGLRQATLARTQALMHLHRYREARAVLQGVLQSWPDDPRAQQLSADLARIEPG